MKNIDKSKPVLVTGATGYVAGKLVERLLQEGLTVRAAVRDKSNVNKLMYLNNVASKNPGIMEYYEADLMQEGSYDAAAEGCEVIFHTASPFTLNVKDAQKDLVEPALEGTRNVLNAANQSSTVKRIVLTSSCAAIYGDNADVQDMPNQKLTEAIWNESSSVFHQPYSYSKTVAEKEAWEMAAMQKKWDLVVINPALVIGPGINPNATSETFNVFKQMADGTMKSGAPEYNIGVVDVRNVAEAHFQAAFRPDAEGRHILSAQTASFLEIASILDNNFKGYPFPKKKLPKFLVWLLGPLAGMQRKVVAKNVGLPWAADNTKSKMALGIKYIPLKQSLVEFFEFLEKEEIVKPV